MTPTVKCIQEDATVTIARLRFRHESIHHLLVVNAAGVSLVMLLQTDVVLNHGVESYLTFGDTRSVMSRTLTTFPAITTHPNSTLLSARNPFAQQGFRHLPVQDETGEFTGLQCFSDIFPPCGMCMWLNSTRRSEKGTKPRSAPARTCVWPPSD